MAWLAAAGRFKTRELHFKARLDRVGHDAICSYANRVECRQRAVDDPAYALLLSWDIPRNGIEPMNL